MSDGRGSLRVKPKIVVSTLFYRKPKMERISHTKIYDER